MAGEGGMFNVSTFSCNQASLSNGLKVTWTPGDVATPTPTPTPPPGSCPATITQSSSQTITLLNSVSCNAGGVHRDNSYYRAFNLANLGITTVYNVSSVSFGVEQAIAGAGNGGVQPITVNLYANNGAAFPNGTLTPIGTANVMLPDTATGTVFSVPVVAAVPAGTLELVYEVFSPDGTTRGGNSFFIGSNTSAQTGPSYLRAPDCGITTPTTTAAVGFPNMRIVMNVQGSCPAGSPTPTPTATATPTPTATSDADENTNSDSNRVTDSECDTNPDSGRQCLHTDDDRHRGRSVPRRYCFI